MVDETWDGPGDSGTRNGSIRIAQKRARLVRWSFVKSSRAKLIRTFTSVPVRNPVSTRDESLVKLDERLTDPVWDRFELCPSEREKIIRTRAACRQMKR